MQSDSSSKHRLLKKFKADKLSLHELVVKNDVDRLICLLNLCQSQGVQIDIDERKNGKTALHIAAKCNVGSSHYKMAKVLLNNGADPNAKYKQDRTPLWYLVKNYCNLEILYLFSKFKGDFTFTNKLGYSLLTPATSNCKNLGVVVFLVEIIGLDVNYRDNNGRTPLHHAASCNKIDSHYEILKYLLKMGADVNAQSNNGWTPIWELVIGGNLKVVDLFLSHNADVNSSSDMDRSVLFTFCYESSDVQVLERMICDFKLNVNHTDNIKCTPLIHIVLCKTIDEPINIKVIKCLLKNGADINTPDEDGITPMIRAMHFLREVKDDWFLRNMDFLNFLIDQTDFSVVHFNKHIYYYEKEYNENSEYRPHSKYLWKWILEHLAKLEFSSIPIHPIVLRFIEDHNDLKDYFEKCTKELEAMKNTKPQNSWITFFNLLVDYRRKIKNYAGNTDLIRDFENNDWLKMFPIYGALIKKNVEKGRKRRELFDKSSVLLSGYLPIFNPTHLIVKDILDCVLSKKDLSKFRN